MTCNEMNLWLLATDLLATPPREVRNHLELCDRCHQSHQRLLHLHAAVHDLPAPPARAAARLELSRRLDVSPGPRVPPWVRWRSELAVAACLLLAVGLFSLMSGLTRAPIEPAPEAEAAPPDVVANVLERHLKLAKGLTPTERFQQLVGLADDLRNEALRLARAPASAELAAVTHLYKRVVREGKLSERAGGLPMAEQRRLLVPLLRELRHSEIVSEQLAANAPGDVARSLRELADTTRVLRAELSEKLPEKML